MQTVTTLVVLRNSVDELRRGGGTIALVPTMGALHVGSPGTELEFAL